MLSKPAVQTETPLKTTTKNPKLFYFVAWRWHFYAGLFVVPFLIVLSLTGLVMLYDDAIEQAEYSQIINIEPQTTPLAPSVQLAAVAAQYPNTQVKQYLTPPAADKASRFAISNQSDAALFITVNPYTAEVLGEINRDESWYSLANDIHGTLLIGDTGDRLIEIAASLSIVLLITGLYLWWPRDKASKAGFLKIRFNSGKRLLWRDLHANIGVITGIFLLLFLVSGLSWAGIWGGKFVQPWNSFPAEKWDNVPLSEVDHSSMNHSQSKEVAWNLEQTPMPNSKAQLNTLHAANSWNIDQVVNFALTNGFSRFRVNFPSSETGVFTVSANTMSGDISDATQDRTTHIDQYSGEVLAEAAWPDYSLMAKFMAAGIALHQGDMGLANVIANTLLCVAFVFIAISGVVMWWLRRPKGALNLAAPPLPQNLPLWKSASLVMIAVSLMFPLAGISLLSVLLLDFILLSRVPVLKRLTD
ncbi:PepSY-associated TM helix domain-containing protein [Agarivorans sp. DSG3-1]|uniref:PepSY-associated TM helix domain-containing protein n=1 Tax=Agarivorans sp. DSG3-1 TaxID=3342249 RepID=UPI00398F75D7